MFGLPIIQDLDDLSEATHISKYTLYQLSVHSDKYYKQYNIPKKSGKVRTISQPSKKLKGVQSWILVDILNKLKVSNFCKGFEKGTSILDNAIPHKGASSILTLDLKDFFNTVDSKRVFNIFKSIGYNNLAATIFTNICTYKNALPQGGPCSPKLANLSAWQLDLRIQGYVGKRAITYTRYADDMSFSGSNSVKIIKALPMLKKIISDEHFEVNNQKTRISGLARAKIVTGLILSNDSISIGREKYKNLRSKIYQLTIEANQSNQNLLFEVQGWLSYLNSVDLKKLSKAKKYISELKTKAPMTLLDKVSY